jgi:hypothetical protein
MTTGDEGTPARLGNEMARSSRAMTVFQRLFASSLVMLGLDPSIHVSPLLERMTRVSTLLNGSRMQRYQYFTTTATGLNRTAVHLLPPSTTT